MILNFFEEQEAYRLARKNHEVREKIKQNEKTALGIHRQRFVHKYIPTFMFFCLLVYLHICLETEEIEQKIRLLQLELEDALEQCNALEVAEVSESESGK